MTRPEQMKTHEHAQGDPEAPLELLSFPRPEGAMMCGTPFGGKIEAMLRIAGVPYTGRVGNVLDKKQAPKRKFPALRHGDNVIADSSCIQAYLLRTYPDQLGALVPADPKQAALELSVRRMLEEDLYFAFILCVWRPDDVFSRLRGVIFADYSGVMQLVLGRVVRKKTLRDLEGQGIGRHSMEYVRERMFEELSACAALLDASGAFLIGGAPAIADCFLFAIIDMGVFAFGARKGVTFAFAEEVRKLPQLLAFHERMKARCFPPGAPTTWQEHAK